MPQFSLKRLFLSVTLFAVGCAMIGWSMRILSRSPQERAEPSLDGLAVLAIIASFPVIGAGIGNIFKRSIWGAYLGFVAFLGIALLGFMAISGSIR
jgi:hypothetical protein